MLIYGLKINYCKINLLIKFSADLTKENLTSIPLIGMMIILIIMILHKKEEYLHGVIEFYMKNQRNLKEI